MKHFSQFKFQKTLFDCYSDFDVQIRTKIMNQMFKSMSCSCKSYRVIVMVEEEEEGTQKNISNQ